MVYQDLGLIFSAENSLDSVRYSQIPTPILMTENIIRVYLAGRTIKNETFIYYIDVCSHNPRKVINIQSNPLLNNGQRGYFDENGIMPSCVFVEKGIYWLYYSGWSVRSTVPYNNLTGCAFSENGLNFKKYGNGPVLSQSIHDPLSATSPWVIKSGKQYVMYYCSGVDWITIDGELEHTYNIKTAISKDLMTWVPTGDVVLQQNDEEEAITRPTVIKTSNGFHMWFCYRRSKNFRGGEGSYKIGYAFSPDSRLWERIDRPITPENSFSDWALDMQCYPAVIKTKEKIFLFYNGNGFGQQGLGVLEIPILI